MNGWKTRLGNLLTACPARVSLAESSRSAFAALVGLVITLGFTAFWLGSGPALTLLPPLGASAVILFALPGSPLAQPWPFLGGSFLAALIGLSCAALLPSPLLAALLAVPLVILATGLTRSTHPPAGAQALLFATSGQMFLGHGLFHALAPLLANLGGMFLGVMLVNNLIQSRRYPALPPANAQGTRDAPPLRRTGLQGEDLRHAMGQQASLLDISQQDLQALFDAAAAHAAQRASGLLCRDIMSRDVLTVGLSASLEDAWRLLSSHHIKALPVVDAGHRVAGVLTRSDFLRPLAPEPAASLAARLGAYLRARPTGPTAPPRVSDLMQPEVLVARDDAPLMELVATLAHSQHRHILVVDDRRRLVGMITQSDLLATLFQQLAGQNPKVSAEATPTAD